MVSNIAQLLASLINAKAKKKAVMCEWERGLSAIDGENAQNY